MGDIQSVNWSTESSISPFTWRAKRDLRWKRSVLLICVHSRHLKVALAFVIRSTGFLNVNLKNETALVVWSWKHSQVVKGKQYVSNKTLFALQQSKRCCLPQSCLSELPSGWSQEKHWDPPPTVRLKERDPPKTRSAKKLLESLCLESSWTVKVRYRDYKPSITDCTGNI